ncbi:MAG: UDP-N-acetylmuramoyl-tripeptide--D-alanyl-D-alanine ligase [Lentimicrobiaceae bacterium]|nr:UDP-N-acetylmuramoyl-tripeptide--D-alanyl-D-alanine ligase [Lentimicrobiaceae bacterium]
MQFPFICTDTRKIVPNSLFFCLKGENFDGNLFVNEALEKGASYVITEERRKEKGEYPLQFLKGCPQGGVVNIKDRIIVVDDVLKTLQQLANYHRNQLKIPIIGITGSNGKTTTKELIASVLSKKYKTAYTQGNLNNHIGVPLTLLSIKNDDEIAVIEMGANHPGEIAELCQIAQPDYGLITNIGKAHLEGFGSIENIIETKTALYRAAQVLFVNAEDPILRYAVCGMRCEVQDMRCEINGKDEVTIDLPHTTHRIPHTTIYYGKNTPISGEIVEMNPYLLINLFGKKIQTHLTGNYNLPNILGAAAIGHFFNVSNQDICDAIAEYAPQNHRSQIIKNGANTIIADYYNANPTSMKAALDNFFQIEAPHKLAILGDMLELGEDSLSEHQAIIDFCESKNIDAIFIGSIFYTLKNERFKFFMNVEDCNNYLKNNKMKDKLILLKGSRGIHLENIDFC